MFKNPVDNKVSYIRRASREEIDAERERIIRTMWPAFTITYRDRNDR